MWATLSLWYNQYMVTYSKITGIIEVPTAGPLTLWAWLNPISTKQASIDQPDDIMAQPNASWKQKNTNAQSTTTRFKFKKKGSLKYWLGRNLDPGLDRVVVGNDPNEEFLYEFGCTSSDAATCGIQVWIKYWVEFSDPENVPKN